MAVINMNAASGQTQINLGGLNNGVFLISVTSDNFNYTGKLVIEK
jgi:hypothetical protein